MADNSSECIWMLSVSQMSSQHVKVTLQKRQRVPAKSCNPLILLVPTAGFELAT